MRILLLAVALLSCHTPAPIAATSKSSSVSAASDNAVTKIVFKTFTRGYERETILTKDSVLIHIRSTFEPTAKTDWKTKISDTQWDKLMNSLKGVDVKKIGDLKAPSMERAVDGAYSSSLEITAGDAYSHSFDDTKPNEQLNPLMKVVDGIEKSTMLK